MHYKSTVIRNSKFVNYKCQDCKYEEQERFTSNEEIPDQLTTFCPMCGGILKKFNLKNNSQRVHVNDPQK
jgi:ribosomal protein L44E